MTVLLQVSDTHFGMALPEVVEALVALAQQQRPDLVVLSGDITQRARPAEFEAARHCMARLAAPLLAVPGNHDVPLFQLWERLRRPHARYAAAFGADLAPVFESAGLLVQGVNTTRAWRHEHGEVSSEQIAQVSQRLRQATAAQLRVVVVHQPLAVPSPAERRHLLRGHQAARQAWAAAGADLVLGGHIHLPGVVPLQPGPRPIWVVQAGTAVSSRVRRGQPQSVNLLRWGPGAPAGRCRIEQWDFAAARQTFVCARATEVQPARP
jgi:3',5'-cyclic AMP phosphodiesterase CpdA